MSWNNYPERDQGSSASIQWRGLSPGWHGMPMGSGCRRAWGSDATPGTEGAAGSFPLRSGSLLEREVNTSLLEILYLTGNLSTPPPPPPPNPALREAWRWFQNYPIDLQDTSGWFLYRFILWWTLWFVSEFSWLIFLDAFISFQVSNLVVKEKCQLCPTLTFKLKIYRVDILNL